MMMRYLGITGDDQFRLRSFLPGNVISKYQSDASYVELFHTVIHNFIDVFATRIVAFYISALGWMILCVVMAGVTVIFQKDQRGKKKVLYVNICMLLCFLLYNMFLLWTYLTTMSDGEATGINCYDRYIGSYIIGWFVLNVYFLFFYHVGSLKAQYLYCALFFLCNICGFLSKGTYYKEADPEIREMYELGNYVRECIPEIANYTSDDMSDLWISFADKKEALNPVQTMQLKYYLFPDFDLIEIYGTQENYGREMKDIVNEFSFDYLVLYGVDEDFYNSYYWFFSDGLSNAREKYEYGQYQAYKIIRDEITDEFCWFEPQ